MAGDWIKIRVDLSDDPDVYQLAEILALDCPTVVGHLVGFWSWMDRHTADGKRIKLSGAVIDRRIMVPGFASALKEIGWLVGEDMNLELPKYDRHNGSSAKARALEAEAKRLRRAGKKEGENVGQVSDKKAAKSPTREEKRREDTKDIHTQPPAKSKKFVKPTIQELTEAFTGKVFDAPREAEKFFNFYESKGWKVGKNPMQSWPHAVGNWAANHDGGNSHAKRNSNSQPRQSAVDRNSAIAAERQRQREGSAPDSGADHGSVVATVS